MFMRIPFLQPRHREFALAPLETADLPAVASIHREDFARPWSEEEFGGLLCQDTVFGFAAREVGHGSEGPVGFVLARLAAGEAEILTVAVARSHRRLGLGWQLMDAVLRELHARRADALFLEVDEKNTPAIALSIAALAFARWAAVRIIIRATMALRRARLSCAAISDSARSGFLAGHCMTFALFSPTRRP